MFLHLITLITLIISLYIGEEPPELEAGYIGSVFKSLTKNMNRGQSNAKRQAARRKARDILARRKYARKLALQIEEADLRSVSISLSIYLSISRAHMHVYILSLSRCFKLLLHTVAFMTLMNSPVIALITWITRITLRCKNGPNSVR